MAPRAPLPGLAQLGIRSFLPEVCAVTLGSVAVNPLEMTNAYATHADGGVRFRASPLLQVSSEELAPVGAKSLPFKGGKKPDIIAGHKTSFDT